MNVTDFAKAARARRKRAAGTLQDPILDDHGDPCALCPNCQGRAFHRAPGQPWRCSSCDEPSLPPILDDGQAGWAFCCLPPPPTKETDR